MQQRSVLNRSKRSIGRNVPRMPVALHWAWQRRSRFKRKTLYSIRGLPESADSEAVQFVVEGIRVRVPRPPQLLQAKLANVATLDQCDRQDVRHVQILIVCTREFLSDALSVAESGEISERAAINALEEVRTIFLSCDASSDSKSSMIGMRDCWPLRELEQSSLPKMVRFRKKSSSSCSLTARFRHGPTGSCGTPSMRRRSRRF